MKVKTKQEVVDIIRENLDKFALFGVLEVGLFGSFVREEQNDESDVDLLVNLQADDPRVYCDNYFALLDFVDTLFGRKVDVITENSITEITGLNICREVEYVTRS